MRGPASNLIFTLWGTSRYHLKNTTNRYFSAQRQLISAASLSQLHSCRSSLKQPDLASDSDYLISSCLGLHPSSRGTNFKLSVGYSTGSSSNNWGSKRRLTYPKLFEKQFDRRAFEMSTEEQEKQLAPLRNAVKSQVS